MADISRSNPNDPLIREIERFMDRHSMSETGFGRQFINNGNFIARLHSAEFSPLDKTVKTLRKRMHEYDALRSTDHKEN